MSDSNFKASTTAPRLTPDDEYNRALKQNVHPPDWINPEPSRRYNLVVIGAGTAGLVCAAGAAGLGAKVALVERHLLGGDCLNFGCVPSKALIYASRLAAKVKTAEQLGIHAASHTNVDFAMIMARMRRLRSQISLHDSVERFKNLGVDVFLGEAHFADKDTIAVGNKSLRFKKAVIATGARAREPRIPGLAETGYLTNETVFSLTERPERLAIVGGGPIGCEMAQAFQGLGSRVVLIENSDRLLLREDPDISNLLVNALREDGVELRFNAQINQADLVRGKKQLRLATDGRSATIEVDEILIAAGRAPNIEGLHLEAAGVHCDERNGVQVDDTLRTTNRRVFAAGDVCLKYKFTHMADASARIVIQNALFFGSKKLSALTVPWCTYTDPEIAHVGLSEQDASAKGIPVDTIRVSMDEIDRAVVEDATNGLLKVHLKKGSDTILGATLVAPHAGEIITEITLAMTNGIGLRRIASVIHPYPTQAEAIKRSADAYLRTLFTPFLSRVSRFLMKFRRY